MSHEHQPIFIHSLFRSGSTYIFNVFRRSPNQYWCYQEPLNEYLLHAATAPGKLLEIHEQKSIYLRHPVLERPYFYEFYPLAAEVARLFRKEFPYDQYFVSENDDITDLKAYFTALIEGAQGRPVFQCCRSTGRFAKCHEDCGGKHIFLWRNPWDQWWSYKVDFYFDRSNLLIANAPTAPQFIKQLCTDLGIKNFHSPDIWLELKHFDSQRLDTAGSYMLFYTLWCHAMLEAKGHCDISINIDRLSTSETYCTDVLTELMHLGINGIDFADCAIPVGIYGKKDKDFFEEIENRVHGLLLVHGYRRSQLDEIMMQRCENAISIDEIELINHALERDAMRVRELSRYYEMELHCWQNKINLDKEQLSALSQRNISLEDDLKAVREHESHLQVCVQAFEEELNTSKAKVSELDQASRHWQGFAEGLLKELEEVRTESQEKEAALQAELEASRQHAASLEGGLKAVREHESHLEARVQALEQELHAFKAKVQEHDQSSRHWQGAAARLLKELEQVRVKSQEKEAALQALYKSASWRITYPIRLIFEMLIEVRDLTLKLGFRMVKYPKRLAQKALILSVNFILARPFLKATALFILKLFPFIKAKLEQIAIRLNILTATCYAPTSAECFCPDLSPRARQIYNDLKRAIEARKS